MKNIMTLMTATRRTVTTSTMMTTTMTAMKVATTMAMMTNVECMITSSRGAAEDVRKKHQSSLNANVKIK